MQRARQNVLVTQLEEPSSTVSGTASQLLRLLAAEAPVHELAALHDDPAEAGADTAADVAVALQVRGVLEQRRRRETELGALYETAGDLSSLRDLEKVLQAIVRRARELLGTDAAYLTLIDEDRGDTHMRVTDGIVTEAFKTLRLPMGAGLGGLVAATATPYATADYATDERFAHVIDDLVSGEQLIAILGVPLRLGERVIGVLFAADRHRRSFAREDVALLSSLAAHAAIAMENARLFSAVRDRLADLTRANEIISSHSRVVERAAEMHERLTALLLSGGGMADVAAAVAAVLGAPLLVVDPAGQVVTSAGQADGELAYAELESGDLAAIRERAQRSGRSERVHRGDGSDGGWVTPVIAGPQHLGALVLLRSELAEADLRTLERAAQVTALLLLNARSLAEAEQRVRGELLEDLLAPVQRDRDGLRRRAALLGADLDAEHVVAVARPARVEARPAALAEAVRLVAEHGGIAGVHDGAVVLLLDGSRPGEGPESVAGQVRARLSAAASEPVTVGAAGPASGPAALAAAHADAARCQEVLLALGRVGQSASPSELGVYGLLFRQAGREELRGFVRATLGPVLEHDAARHTELVRTLTAYFACDGNVARTAGALFVHVNTLYQRLDRVSQLLGSSWRQGDPALQLHLAVRIHQVLDQG